MFNPGLAATQQAVPLFIKGIAKDLDIEVSFSGDPGHLENDDGSHVIWLPPYATFSADQLASDARLAEMQKVMQMLFLATGLHEVGHATDTTPGWRNPGELGGFLWNALEDVRIDTKRQGKLIGAKRIFVEGYGQLMKMGWWKPITMSHEPLYAFQMWVLYAGRATLAGQDIFDTLAHSAETVVRALAGDAFTDAAWSIISKTAAAKKTEDVFHIVNELLALLKSQSQATTPPPPPPPPPSPPQQQDEGDPQASSQPGDPSDDDTDPQSGKSGSPAPDSDGDNPEPTSGSPGSGDDSGGDADPKSGSPSGDDTGNGDADDPSTSPASGAGSDPSDNEGDGAGSGRGSDPTKGSDADPKPGDSSGSTTGNGDADDPSTSPASGAGSDPSDNEGDGAGSGRGSDPTKGSDADPKPTAGASAPQSGSSGEEPSKKPAQGGKPAGNGSPTDVQPGDDPAAGGGTKGSPSNFARQVLDASESDLPPDVGSAIRQVLDGVLAQAQKAGAIEVSTPRCAKSRPSQAPYGGDSDTQPLSMRIRRLLEAQSKSHTGYDRRGSRMDRGLLSRVPLGHREVFVEETRARRVDTALMLLVDRSSSMKYGNRVEIARKAALRLSIALAAIPGTSVSCAAFPEQLDSRDDQVLELLPFGAPVRRYAHNFLNLDAPSWAGTPMCEALVHARFSLLRQLMPRKICVVLTDGGPNGEGVRERPEIEAMRKCGIEVIGVGIQTMECADLFPRFEVVDDVSELESAMFRLLQSVLLSKKAA